MGELNVNYKPTFDTFVFHSPQKDQSAIVPAVETGSIDGDYLYKDEFNSVMVKEVFGLNQKIDWESLSVERRRIHLRRFNYAALLDNFEKTLLMHDPQSDVVKAAKMAWERMKDEIIYDAFDADVETGYDGSGTVTFDGNNVITAASGITLDVLNDVIEKFKDNEVPNNAKLYMLLAVKSETDVRNIEKYQNTLYNSSQPLVEATLPPFMGINFIPYKPCTLDGTTRKLFAWAEGGMSFGVGKEVTTKVIELDDYVDSYGIKSIGYYNALRNVEEYVLRIDCTET